MSEAFFKCPDLVVVGQILSAHGQEGALNIKVITDVPNRFDTGQVLTIDGRRFVVAGSRGTGPSTRILWLQEVSSRDQAKALQGQWLSIPAKDVPELEEGEYFHFQLLGMEVHTEDGELLGNIGRILETGSNDVYVIEGPTSELLLPAIMQVVRHVDVAGRRMTVRLLDGLR